MPNRKGQHRLALTSSGSATLGPSVLRLARCASPKIVSVIITALAMLGYRILLAPMDHQPEQISSMSYFTKSWMWLAVLCMGMTIVAATVRSVLKNTGGKQGYMGSFSVATHELYQKQLYPDEEHEDMNASIVYTDSSTYLKIGMLSGMVALSTFALGVYTLVYGLSTFKEEPKPWWESHTYVFAIVGTTLALVCSLYIWRPSLFKQPFRTSERNTSVSTQERNKLTQ